MWRYQDPFLLSNNQKEHSIAQTSLLIYVHSDVGYNL
jgi:hypothetical protein